jgi:cytochrome c oxidase cbb3-type subunit III
MHNGLDEKNTPALVRKRASTPYHRGEERKKEFAVVLARHRPNREELQVHDRELMQKSCAFCATAIGLLLAGAAVVELCAQNPAAGNADGPARQAAKTTFENVCAGCHGLDGHGGERGPDIASRREVVRKSDADLVLVLKEGRVSAGMPAFGAYGEEQLLALVAYLRSLQGGGLQRAPAGDPTAGKALFSGKAKCSECHMVEGKGGFFASDLSAYANLKTADDLRAAIVTPNRNRDPRTGPVRARMADRTVLTGMPRNEDNFSLQLLTPDGTLHLLNKATIVELTRLGGSAMHSDYGRTLSAREIDNLIGFLQQVASSRSAKRPAGNGDDDE